MNCDIMYLQDMNTSNNLIVRRAYNTNVTKSIVFDETYRNILVAIDIHIPTSIHYN